MQCATDLKSVGSARIVCSLMGGIPSNAALVGANTVNGPGSVRSVTRPDNLRAATNVEKIGL